MDDFAVHRGKVLGIANHTVVKTGTHSQQHIAVLHGVIGFKRTVHAQHAKESAVVGRKGAQAHQGVGHWIIEHVHQSA